VVTQPFPSVDVTHLLRLIRRFWRRETLPCARQNCPAEAAWSAVLPRASCGGDLAPSGAACPDFGSPKAASIRARLKGEARAGRDARSLLREAVEQAVATSSDEVGPGAGAGLVCRVPGMLEIIVGAAAAVHMADPGLAKLTARPVVAGQVHVARECGAVGLRAGQHVVIVRRIAEARNPGAALGQRILGV